MKLSFFFCLLFFCLPYYSKAIIQGCHNGSAVYTTFLGYTNFYGTNYEVYSSTGDVVTIYNNQDGQNSPPCGQIVSTGTVSQGYQCWIAASLPPTNSSSGVSWQTKVTVTGSYTPCPVPFDDYIFPLLFLLGCLGYYQLCKKVVVNY
ncbi:MAG: hypothetical protein EOO90_29540 [Pedobacter sp.]|nr:MAG: hypothetical protein EOO90_29540 [Pedobacter sp.]